MDKIYLSIGAVALVLVTGLYFVVNNSPTKQSVTNPIISATSTNTEVTNATSNSNISEEERLKYVEIDLSKLPGKDRLYTEDEGRFENLSEEEQMVLIEAYYCRDYESRGKMFCKQHAVIYGGVKMENVRLLALRDGVAVVYVKGDNPPGGRFFIYNLIEHKLISEIPNVGNVALSSDFIIHANHSEKNNHLELYRPGMKNFVSIPESDISNNSQANTQISYLEYTDPFIHASFPIDFSGEVITVYQHTYNYTEIESSFNAEGLYTPRYIERDLVARTAKVFDISNLR